MSIPRPYTGSHLADYIVDRVGDEEVAGRVKCDADGFDEFGVEGGPIIPQGSLPVPAN